MIFYKILLDHDPSQQWNVVKGIMDFVDIKRNKKARREEIYFTEEAISFVSDLIVQVYDRIKAHDFDHKCDRWQCKWCELVESEFQHGSQELDEENVGVQESEGEEQRADRNGVKITPKA
jgi:DNA helicase-2/ATP-dependent DNA helicase PcrA